MSTTFLNPPPEVWDRLKQDYLTHSRIPERLIEFLKVAAVALADDNIFEPDRSKEEKRKGAVILIRDLISIHDDLLYAVNPKPRK